MLVIRLKYNKSNIFFKGDQQECGEFLKLSEKLKFKNKNIDYIESDSIEWVEKQYNKAYFFGYAVTEENSLKQIMERIKENKRRKKLIKN